MENEKNNRLPQEDMDDIVAARRELNFALETFNGAIVKGLRSLSARAVADGKRGSDGKLFLATNGNVCVDGIRVEKEVGTIREVVELHVSKENGEVVDKWVELKELGGVALSDVAVYIDWDCPYVGRTLTKEELGHLGKSVANADTEVYHAERRLYVSTADALILSGPRAVGYNDALGNGKMFITSVEDNDERRPVKIDGVRAKGGFSSTIEVHVSAIGGEDVDKWMDLFDLNDVRLTVLCESISWYFPYESGECQTNSIIF